jgi:hypothetical protein
MTVVMLAASPTNSADTSGGAPSLSQAEQAAGERARHLLAETLKVAEENIEITKVEPKTWNDSRLGCGNPQSLAMQVITDGFAVSLRANGREHSVHVAGSNAVVCDRSALTRKDARATHARGLDVMMEKARQDLAKRLGVESVTIRIAGMKPQQWENSAMECPIADEAIQPGPLRGYRISLQHQSRIYTYHTDMKTVRPCPPIERG